jgi:hypothetical protein
MTIRKLAFTLIGPLVLAVAFNASAGDFSRDLDRFIDHHKDRKNDRWGKGDRGETISNTVKDAKIKAAVDLYKSHVARDSNAEAVGILNSGENPGSVSSENLLEDTDVRAKIDADKSRIGSDAKASAFGIAEQFEGLSDLDSESNIRDSSIKSLIEIRNGSVHGEADASAHGINVSAGHNGRRPDIDIRTSLQNSRIKSRVDLKNARVGSARSTAIGSGVRIDGPGLK